MRQYEYTSFLLNSEDHDALEKLGVAGWKMCGVVMLAPDFIRFYFVRELQ